jgi:hypothetical protein
MNHQQSFSDEFCNPNKQVLDVFLGRWPAPINLNHDLLCTPDRIGDGRRWRLQLQEPSLRLHIVRASVPPKSTPR